MSDEVIFTWAKVFINGKDYGVHQVKVKAEVGNDAPGRLSIGSGISQRTGEIHWDAESDKNLILNPFNRKGKNGFTLPKHGDRVQVRMGKQETDPRRDGFTEGELVFTGKVDVTTTSHTGEAVTEIVDDIDRLNRVIRLPAVKHHMPPSADTRIGWYLHNGVTPDTILGWAASACGYHVTPPPTGITYLSAPLQGSTLIHQRSHGRLINSQLTRGDTYNLPSFVRTSRGLALAQGMLTYAASSQAVPKRLVISAMVGAQHAGEAVINTKISEQVQLRVMIAADRKVSAQVGGTRLGHVTPAPDAYVSVAFTEDGKAVLATGEQSVEVQLPTWATAPVSEISVSASAGSAIAGLNVTGEATPTGNHPALSFKQTAFIDCGYWYPLHLARSIRDEKAISVIEEICEATSCISYLDGEGNLRIQYGRAAHNTPVVGTLTARKDVRGFSIKEDSQLAAYRAVIKYQTVDAQFTNKSHGSYVTLWEAPSSQLEAGESIEHFITAGSDEEFFEVDTTLTYANASDQARADFNAGNGSFFGFAATNGTAEWWAGGTVKLETITPWVYKLTATPHGKSRTAVPEVPAVRTSRWGAGMPVIRCGAKVTRVDADPIISTGGSVYAADLVHEAGAWVTDSRATDLGDHAMNLAKNPLPVITGLDCFFNPAIQVGQRWVIDLTDITGFKAACFVLGVTHDPAADVSSLDIRLLSQINDWTWGRLASDYDSFEHVTTTFASYSALKEGPTQ